MSGALPSTRPASASIGLHNSAVTSLRDTYLNVNQYLSSSKAVDAKQTLQEHVAFGALFNSNDRFDLPACHPDTRVAVLEAIDQWARGLDGVSQPIMWLRGPAGAGKSAIAQTSAERWEATQILAASFFFSRIATKRNEKKYLIPTIAYQLSLSIPSTWPFIERAILRDVGLFEKNLQTQVSELIVAPLKAAASEGFITWQVVVIDGPDECSLDYDNQNHEEQQREILDAIALATKDPNFPLRFLICSRPERQIRTSFNQKPLLSLASLITLDSTQHPNADIELYLQCKFREIKQNHPYLGTSWPPVNTIPMLLAKSSGQFIYAAVVIRYLQQPRIDPRVGLETIIGLNSPNDQHDTPFAALDTLYIHILESIAPHSLPPVTKILELLCFGEAAKPSGDWVPSWTVFSPRHCRHLSPVFIEKYLFLPFGQAYLHLVDLHSIIEVPPEEKARDLPIRFLHASFGDFLVDPLRSGTFHIPKPDAFLHLQLLRLKHVLLQVVSPDALESQGYTENGFVLELRTGLGLSNLPPSAELAKGVAVLVEDDDGAFGHYVQNLNLPLPVLDSYTRNPKIMEYLLQPDYLETTVVWYLKKCDITLKQLSLFHYAYSWVWILTFGLFRVTLPDLDALSRREAFMRCLVVFGLVFVVYLHGQYTSP